MDKALKKRQKLLSETWPSAETTVTMAPATGPGRRTVCSMVVPPEHGPPERAKAMASMWVPMDVVTKGWKPTRGFCL